MAFKKLKKIDQELENYKNEPISNSINNLSAHNKNQPPWGSLNKNAVRPKKQFILKLNEYYHAALSHFSNQEEGVSMQKVVNDILTPALNKMIKDYESK